MSDKRRNRSWFLACSLGLNAALLVGGVLHVAEKGGVGFLMRRAGLEKTQIPLQPFQRQMEEFQAALPINAADTVFVGDSITADGPFADYFSTIKTRGVGGETTSGILARIDSIADKKPAKLFLLAGTNDLCRDIPVDEIVENYAQIIERIHSRSPETKTYVLSVPPLNASIRRQPYDPSPVVPELNRRLAAMCRERSVPFIDLVPALQDSQGHLDARLTIDGLHLNAAGYARIMPLLAPYQPGAAGAGSHITTPAGKT